MIQLIRRYIGLMRDHDYDYNYIDDFAEWSYENEKRYQIYNMRAILKLTLRGQKIVKLAEKRYWYAGKS